MKRKIMLGLSLLTPLTVMAIDLEGTHSYNEFIEIPHIDEVTQTDDGIFYGLYIKGNSNTTFNKSVHIDVSQNDDIPTLSIDGITSQDTSDPSNTIFNGNLDILVHGQNATAISLYGENTSVIVNGDTRLQAYFDNNENNVADAIFISGATLSLKGDSFIIGNIGVHDSGKLEINKRSRIIGDILATSGGQVNLNLAHGSMFTGSTSIDRDSDNSSEILKINLEKGASWMITNQASEVTNLSGKGEVEFDHYTNEANDYGKLMVDVLDGQLNFVLHTNIAEQKSDMIQAKEAKGKHTIKIKNDGSAQTTGNEKLLLVDINPSNDNTDAFNLQRKARSDAEFKLDHKVEFGGYEYALKRDGNQWHLARNDNHITTTADASASSLYANYLMNFIETQTLLQRLGDIHNSGQSGNVWARGFAGKLNSFAGKQLSSFDMNYHGLQFGADKQLSEDSPFVIGAFVGQTYGNPNFHKGDGSLRSFNTGLYTSYLNNDGTYVDVVGKYSRQRNHFKVKDTDNNNVQGTGHTNGLGLSIELGKKFNFNEFYIEPQAQLSYAHQNDGLIHATNGLKVKLGDYNSLIGRTSALFGYEINSENNKVNLYAKTGFVREFDGDTYYKLNNSKESHSFKGNWWNNGVGVNAQINNQHTIYFDLESSPGNKFDLLQVNGGYRYSF